jgi:hypothetical protein
LDERDWIVGEAKRRRTAAGFRTAEEWIRATAHPGPALKAAVLERYRDQLCMHDLRELPPAAGAGRA